MGTLVYITRHLLGGAFFVAIFTTIYEVISYGNERNDYTTFQPIKK